MQIALPVVLYESNGRTYILDGHHRWAQVHALNSDGKIKAVVLTSASTGANTQLAPLRMLAVLQLSVAAATGVVPSGSAGRQETNLLLAASNDATVAYLRTAMSDGFVELYNQTLGATDNNNTQTRDAIAASIMRSIAVMQQTRPVDGAPTRDLMPQTDGTAELKAEQSRWRSPLAGGRVNFKPY